MAEEPTPEAMPPSFDELISEFSTKRTPLDVKSLESGDQFSFAVEDEDAGTRLDAFLAMVIEGVSRNRLKDLVKSGQTTIDGKKQTKPNTRLKAGETVGLIMPPAEDPTPLGEDIPLTIVYEDDDLIVVDKPANMVVHPAAGNWTGTLVNALIYHCGDTLSGIGGIKRPGIVHRLDKETSGLLVVAKNDQTHQGLTAQFADHGRTGPLRRAYKAIVWNEPARAKGTIHTEIARSVNNRLKMAVVAAGGREAITHYDILEAFGREGNQGTAMASLVACHLETGRTHQIRVHMTHISCPLIGDPVYSTGYQTKSDRLPDTIGGKIKSLKRQALHAFLLQFEHPITGETLRFESELPSELTAILEPLRKL